MIRLHARRRRGSPGSTGRRAGRGAYLCPEWHVSRRPASGAPSGAPSAVRRRVDDAVRRRVRHACARAKGGEVNGEQAQGHRDIATPARDERRRRARPPQAGRHRSRRRRGRPSTKKPSRRRTRPPGGGPRRPRRNPAAAAAAWSSTPAPRVGRRPAERPAASAAAGAGAATASAKSRPSAPVVPTAARQGPFGGHGQGLLRAPRRLDRRHHQGSHGLRRDGDHHAVALRRGDRACSPATSSARSRSCTRPTKRPSSRPRPSTTRAAT